MITARCTCSITVKHTDSRGKLGLELEEKTLRTYRYEQLRAVASGIIEAAQTTFFLLVALRWFGAGPAAKSLIASSVGFGFVLTPFVVYAAYSLRLQSSRAAAILNWIPAVLLAAAAIWPTLELYVAAVVLSLAIITAAIPFYTQIYHENYPAEVRGRLFSQTMMTQIGVAGVFALAAGRLLSGRIQYFQVLLVLCAAAAAYRGYCAWMCPAAPLVQKGEARFMRGFSYAVHDRVFRQTLLAWMLMGFGSVMMLPLRVECLANPKYGHGFSEFEVALFVTFLPNVARLLVLPVWGMLFDRMNFFMLRISVNMALMLGILTFFFDSSIGGLVLGALTFGIASAGGDVCWSLWVTKFAPSDRIADYMSVHTFMTGIRGILAPLLSFHLALHWQMTSIAWLSAGLIFSASLLLVPEIRAARHFVRLLVRSYPPEAEQVCE